jgi:DASH complex subunit DAD3
MAASETTSTSCSPIFSVNPYENHPSLSQLQADVLWEYAKLNQHIKDVRTPTPLAVL